MGFAKYHEDILSRLIHDKYLNNNVSIKVSMEAPINNIQNNNIKNSNSINKMDKKSEKDDKVNSIKKYVIPSARPLPIIILADTSGSMSENGKIEALNASIKDMIMTFSKESRLRAEIQIGLITFGGRAQMHLPLVSAHSVSGFTELKAEGVTPMGAAFEYACQLLEDKDRIPSRAYRPVLILISDGHPTDDWEAPFKALCQSERAQKASRLAMAIGSDADEVMLKKFVNDVEAPVFRAHNARDIHRFFRAVTMSVTTRTKSHNPDQAIGFVVPPPDDELLDLDF